MSVTPKELALNIAQALYDKKALDVKIIDVASMTAVTDYFVVAGARSSLQVNSLSDELEEKMGELGVSPTRQDGRAGGRWVVQDYNSVIVHIFHQEEREFYDLERLWNNGMNVSVFAPDEE